ncbi:MAG TPA: Glu/Leu/Phe/Val dehydrogenase dimerization domain-containing protein [Gammaproteobacteria bacterium]|jgi:leucine dehydrogenase|nr:Glu/Leu/Phe/Val dehydrogenase dimerization domain-containing protein [Gammaproteobacteria bacterium]
MKSHKKQTILDSLMRYATSLGYGQIHTKIDKKTGLQAFVAIHSTTRGPAIGGCRCVPYHSAANALEDALRLGYMMSYKAAISNLPHGGAKAVLMKPAEIKDRKAYFESYGDFVNELGGRYITAVDSGTDAPDMDVVATRTSFVTCTSSGLDNDPSLVTAIGVKRGIEAAVKFKLNRASVEGIRVAIQGAGHVGYYLAKEMHALGAKIMMTDINPQLLKRCVEEFDAEICRPDEIYQVKADVFAPCALGAVLNLSTIGALQVSIVAGSANNQLAHYRYSSLLQERGILYAPDFLINAGGLIHVAAMYAHKTTEESHAQISNIYETAYDVFERAAKENVDPNAIAIRIARERITEPRP